MKQKMFSLPKLGLNKNHANILKDEIVVPQGMILVTGPTGSGKTTTLYTLLRMLNTEEVNICTIEDPVEYGIDNINQMQVKPQVGLTFANGLKSLLRQDPNVIMVGEIRDTETANIAVNSAMTGHLVLSTLHTNNAFSAPQRLVEIGVQPYLVNSVINIAVGQRLVRTLCKHCRIKLRSSEKLLKEFSQDLNFAGTLKKLQQLGHLPSKAKLSDIQFYRHRGCSKCNNTGYTGRVGIYEVFKVDDKLRNIILHDSSEKAVKDYLLKKDTLTMTEDGLLKVFNGQTTIDEVIRVTKG
jgi:type II secretory ATPase GspE/PulE/Tfp pilus assembly ATPase PilB-like protein